jgi:hypothetical protein
MFEGIHHKITKTDTKEIRMKKEVHRRGRGGRGERKKENPKIKTTCSLLQTEVAPSLKQIGIY